jgi:hypothetical protein
MAAKDAEAKGEEIQRGIKRSQEDFQLAQRTLQSKIDTATVERERAAILSGILGLENTAALQSKIAAENSLQDLQNQKSLDEIQQKQNVNIKAYTEIQIDRAKSGRAFTAAEQLIADGLVRSIVAGQQELDIFKQTVEERKALKAVNDEIALISSRSAAKSKELDFENNILKVREELAKVTIDSKKQEFDALVAQGRLSEEYAAKRLADIDKENQAIALQSQLREAASIRDAATNTARTKAAQAEAVPGANLEAIEVTRIADENKALEIYNQQVQLIQNRNAQILRGIELTKQQNLETAAANTLLEKQKGQMDSMQSITDSLAALFGNLGSAVAVFAAGLGKTGEALLANSQNQETFNVKYKQYTDRIKEIEGIDDPMGLSPETQAEYNKLIDNRSKLVKKNAADEIAGNLKVIGSAKAMFKEKTVAHKALGTLEKGLHVMKIANDTKELASTLGLISAETAATIGGTLKKIPAYAADIYGKTIGQLGPIAGPVVATALLAALYSFLGGGGSTPQPAGITAKEQQEVQGTGRYYENGKIVDTGAGVLGDSSARSETVAKGIQAIEKYTFKNLVFSNDMLDALKAIERNTKSFTSGLLRAIPNLNVTPETLKSGNWLFGKETTETLDRGIGVIGTVGQIIDKSAKLIEYSTTKTTDSGFLGLFGGGTSYGAGEKDIENSQRLQEDLSGIFSEMGNALGIAGENLGLSTKDAVMTAFRGMDLTKQLKTSLMGLTGTEAAEAFLSVVSSGMDTAALTIFPSLAKFREIGESFGDTVIRLSNDMNVVSLSFEEMGFTLPKLAETGASATAEQLDRVTRAQTAYNSALAATKVMNTVTVIQGDNEVQTQVMGSAEATAALVLAQTELTAATNAVNVANSSLTTKNIELVQSLIEAAGGLDQFVEKNRFFADNFLTEAERLAPIRERVNAEFSRLNTVMAEMGVEGLDLTLIDTREEFRDLVLSLEDTNNSLNITTPAGEKLYTALMNVQYGFVEVTKSADTAAAALSEQELNNKILEQQISILKLLGNEQDAVTLSRTRELDALAKYPKEQADVLIANQKYIYALEDEQKAKDALIKQRDKLKGTINTLKSALDNIVNYRQSLMGGELSPLSPTEKYFGAQSEFERLRDIASGPATTEAEQRAQQDAISKLPAAADKFLQSSRTLFASGAEYTRDFDSVTAALSAAESALQLQLTDAEKQLNELETQTDILTKIESSSKTTAELIQAYLDAQKNVASASSLASPLPTVKPITYTAVSDALTNTGTGTASGNTASGNTASGNTAASAASANTVAGTPPAIIGPQPQAAQGDNLVAEVAKITTALETLTEEVTTLRREQSAQTGEVITSNAAVTNNSTTNIVNAVVDSISNQDWINRSKPVIGNSLVFDR